MLYLHIRPRPYVHWTSSASISQEEFTGWIALCVTTIAAGTYNGFAKPLTGALSPLSLLFLSELLTGLFALFSFGLLPTIRKFLRLPREAFFPLLALALCNGTIAPLLLFQGLHGTSAMNASLFANSEMLFLTLLAVLVLREQWTGKHMIATGLMVAGLLVIALRGFTETLQLQPGDLIILSAGFVFAIGSIIFRRFLHHLEPQVAIVARSALAVCMFFLLSPFVTTPLINEVRAFPPALLPALLGFGFIARFLNIFTFYGAIDRLPVSTVSLVSNLTIITSILFARLYLGETIEPYHITGGTLIILGTILLELLGIHPTSKHLESHLEERRPHRP